MNSPERFYLDYNATAPYAVSVVEWLKAGDFPYANPSSVHTSGKKVRREINRSKEFLFETFNLSDGSYQLIFHSGATEGINTIVKGLSRTLKRFHFIYCEADHSCVRNQRGFLEADNKQVSSYRFADEDALEELLSANQGDDILLNWTWVNNETGLVSPLDKLKQLKEKYHFYVHVDAVQSVGKLEDWSSLSDVVDFYTYSAHKFGALKGAGFSFVREGIKLEPLLNGGGQQLGLRSGTENTMSILSIPLALQEMKERYDFSEQWRAKKLFEERLLHLLGDKGEIVGQSNPHRNGNTTYFILYDTKAQSSAMALDMAGFDVSNGSACSSGAVIPSHVLMSMGHSEEHAKSAIRISFSPFVKEEDIKNMWVKLETVLKRFV